MCQNFPWIFQGTCFISVGGGHWGLLDILPDGVPSPQRKEKEKKEKTNKQTKTNNKQTKNATLPPITNILESLMCLPLTIKLHK